jgi:magnesium transporter
VSPRKHVATSGGVIRVMVCEAGGGLRTGGEELLETAPRDGISVWIDLEGAEPRFEKMLRKWGCHPLAIEDTFTVQHQPRVEEYAGTVFAIVRGLDFNVAWERDWDDVATLKLAAFVSHGRLVTVHRGPLRSLETVRRRVTEVGQAPPGGVLQVFWSVCDEMMDLYFPVVDRIAEEIEKLEEEVVEQPRHEHLERVLALRRQLATLRRTMLPHRQVFQHLANSRGNGIDDTAALNFRDTLDNVLRLTDAIDQQRDLLTNVKDTYLSVVAQRTNDVMRVLTVFSAIILPLSLIAGVYGMNFENMPELHSRWGYFVVLVSMVSLASGMLLWFRRKGWL